MMIFHKPFRGYIVGCTLGAFITVICKKLLLSDTFSYTVYINYISKLASPDFKAEISKENLTTNALYTIFWQLQVKSKHPKADFLP